MKNQQGSEKKKVDPVQMLKRGRSSKVLSTKSPGVDAKDHFMSRGDSMIKMGSGTISGSGVSGTSGGGISLTRKNSMNKVVNTKLRIKSVSRSNDLSMKPKKHETSQSKIKFVMKSRNMDELKKLKTTTENSNKFQPRPLSSRKMTMQVPNKSSQNKENFNTKNVAKKISLQRKMSV